MPDAQNFIIPQAVQEQHADLVEMLKKSESIDNDEKQYWFSALETMDEDQVGSLRQILEDEQKQVEDIEEKYDEKTQEAFDQADAELREKQRREQMEARRKAEHADRQEDIEKQEELLSMLDEL